MSDDASEAMINLQRRTLCGGAALAPLGTFAQPGLLKRTIPASGERIPAVGLGTWLTFDVPLGNAEALARRAQVLQRFWAGGGALIDSSPMYGTAEAVLGELLPRPAPQLFSATKVWTPLTLYGPTQLRRSLALWKLPRVDLLQVHNLLNWQSHLKTLREWKDDGRARYIGITTSHGRANDEAAAILKREKLDFLQITYNPHDRSAEPAMALAAERGVAVIINRPFDGGAVLDRLSRRTLPGIAAEFGCSSWATLVLKWALSNPLVTCAIPATTDPAHVDQNLAALQGVLPQGRQRDEVLKALLA